MTNILFCTYGYFPDKSGGAEQQARLQAEELVRRGHQVTVVCPRRRRTRNGEVGGVKVYRIPIIERRYLRELSYCLLLSLFLLCRIRRFQLLHIHMPTVDSVVICFMARLFRRPVYVKVARGGPGGDARYLADRWYLRRFTLAYPARFQAISNEIASDLTAIGVSPDRLVQIPNGVNLPDANASPPEKSRLRAELELPLDAVLVLFLGRFVQIKGQDVLLDAWAKLRPSGAILVLVGRRPWESQFVLGSGERRDASDVIVRDWTEEPEGYLAAADIFVLPSRGEGMSNALLRAMAHGLPVIATRVGAAEAMIEDGQSGCLIQVDDPVQLAADLQKLIDELDLRTSMGAAARSRVSRLFSIESVVDRIEAEYREILRQKR